MKTAEEVFNEYVNIRSVGNDIAQNIVDAMVNYAEQFKPRWVVSNERLPEIDGYIWAHCSISGNDEKVWFDDALPISFKERYSHWQPLPEYP